MSPKECQETWKTLKHTYTILQEGKNSGYDVGVKWRYEESMKFLAPYLLQQGETHTVSDEEYREKSISSIEDDQYEVNEKLNNNKKRVCIDNNGPSTSKKQKTDYEETMVASTNIDIKFIKFVRSVEKLPQAYQEELKHKIYKAVSQAKHNFNSRARFWANKSKQLKKRDRTNNGSSKERISRSKTEKDQDPNYQSPKLKDFIENKPETGNLRRSSRIRKIK